MIININIENLYPHPHNPRKDLSNLEELAESIKTNGVLQNLTVVPWNDEIMGKPKGSECIEDCYIVIIGHRRLAASKLAGLKELPCVISEMDHRTQVATMLLENMQRNDLTLYEEAQGIQMMLDFGDTVSDISGQTGISETTVRRRVKLLELDKDKFKESVERGATLTDYLKLEKIKNPDLKNKILDKIGTDNFNFAIKNAIEDEKWEDRKSEMIAVLNEFASPVEKEDGLSSKSWYSRYTSSFPEKPKDADKVKYYYIVTDYNIQLLREATAEDKNKPQTNAEHDKKREEIQANHEKLKAISKQSFELRKEFIKGATTLKKQIKHIQEFTVRTLMFDIWSDFDEELFAELMGIEFDEDEGVNFDAIVDIYAKSPERILLIATYCNYGDSRNQTYFSWNNQYQKNEELDTLYEFLEKLGYQISEEERALKEGTHGLFEPTN